MIQDIGAHSFHNEYRPVPPSVSDCLLFFRGRTALVRLEQGALSFPRFWDLPEEKAPQAGDCTYLFSIDDTRYYLAPDSFADRFPGFTFADIVLFRESSPAENCFALITGYQLALWYKNHRFCSVCGHPTVHSDRERMLSCPSCGFHAYPRISPAVIVGVRDRGRLLLSKYAGPNAVRYALIAGFCEIGETLEDTVRREVMEETGLRVKNISYYKSQPWSLTGTLLAGFYCDVDGSDAITLDREELAEARWFAREEIPYDDFDVSLTREMMLQFKKGLF